MADVARRAGVSAQTVSRVVNDNGYISVDARRRVEEAIKALNYRPNDSARALRASRSAVIGVVSLESTLHGPVSVLLSVEQAVRLAGFYLSVVTVAKEGRRPVLEAIERLNQQGVAGIVMVASFPQAHASGSEQRIPLVLTEHSKDVQLPWVGVDQVSGARAATTHLLELGHRTVWHVAGPSHMLSARARREGWSHALRDAGIRAPQPIVGDWSPASGYAAGLKLASNREVTAVFVANDQMAIGLLNALDKAGLSVPDDVSVVGFDDIPEAGYLRPELTTMRQDFAQLGQRAVQLLVNHLRSSPAPPFEMLPMELVQRASTARPGKRRG